MFGRKLRATVMVAVAPLTIPSVGFAGNVDGSGGSGATGGAVLAEEFASRVKDLSYNGKKHKWTGRVTNDFEVPFDAIDVENQVEDDVCVNGRTVKLFKKGKRHDVEVGKDKTNADGKFKIIVKKKPRKKYYVQVTEAPFVYRDYYAVEINGICLGAKKDF